MDGEQFDALTKTLARSQSRRAALKMLVGMALGGVGAALWGRQAARAGKMPGAGPGALCNQPYALCTSAPCQPSANDPNTVTCGCLVLNGYSYGHTSCEERAPSGNTLISTFSLQNVTSQTRAMTCSVGGAGGLWANCLDSPCQLDPTDPTRALCQCPVTRDQQFFTFGGDCDVSTCTSVIWSGATVSLAVTAEYTSAMQQLNQPVPTVQSCPSS
jgi:hypothetical protein